MTQPNVPSEEVSNRLPEQVRKSAERARQFLRDKMDPKAAEPPKVPEGVVPNVEAKPIPSAPSVEPQTAKPETTAPAAPQQVEDPRHSDINYWKHRVSIIDGLLRKAKKDKDAEVGAIKEQLSVAQKELHKLKTSAPMPTVDPKQFFSAEEIEILGESQAQILAQAQARQRHQDEVARENERFAAEQEASSKEEAKRQREAAEATNQMIADLAREVPDWEVVNKSNGWLAWLAEIDEFTGFQRQELVDIAESKADGKALAKLMKRYLGTLNIAPVPAQPTVQPTSNVAGGHVPAAPSTVSVKGPPSRQEAKEFFERLKFTGTRGFKPPGFKPVTTEERAEFFARMNAAQVAA